MHLGRVHTSGSNTLGHLGNHLGFGVDVEFSPRASMVATSVRQADLSDVPALTALINRAYQVEEFFVDGARITAREVGELTSQGQFLVLDDADGGLVAAVQVDCSGDCGYLGLLSVDPDRQGLGLGKRLVAVAEAMGSAMGCASMGLRVVNIREDLAPWYRRLGYAETGTSPFSHRLLKQPAHFIEMHKILPS